MANATDGVHRLSNITVEEVSLVDRAANQRKFLVAKREGSEDMGATIRSDGRGGFTKVTKAEEEEAEKAGKPPFPGAAKPFGSDKDKKDDEEKKKKDEEEKKKSETSKVDAEGMKLAKEVGDIAKELGELSKEMAAEESDEPNDVHMKKLIAAHKSMSGMVAKYLKSAAKSLVPSEVKKIGAKMAASRLSLMKEALESLQSLLAELTDTPAKAKDHAADAGDPQMAPTGWSKSNPSGAPGSAEGAAAIKAMQKSLDDTVGEMQKLVEMNKQLVDRNKSLAKRNTELENQVIPGNSLVVEKSTKSEEPVWPMDMAADVRKRAEKDPDRFD